MANEIVDLELRVGELLQKGIQEAYFQVIEPLEKLRGLYDDKSRIAETNTVLNAINEFRGLGEITPQEDYLKSIDPEYPGEERSIALSCAFSKPTREEIAERKTVAQRKIGLFLEDLQKRL